MNTDIRSFTCIPEMTEIPWEQALGFLHISSIPVDFVGSGDFNMHLSSSDVITCNYQS